MKKLMALLLALTLVMGALLVSCNDDEETDYQDLQTNSTEWETASVEPEGGDNDVLGVGADTDDSWGPIQKN